MRGGPFCGGVEMESFGPAPREQKPGISLKHGPHPLETVVLSPKKRSLALQRVNSFLFSSEMGSSS